MKKTVGKLTMRKETLIQLNDLRHAPAAGVRETIAYTIHHPEPSDGCTRGCPVLA